VKQGKRSGRDAELVWGKHRRLAGVSIKLHLSMGGVTMSRWRFNWAGGGDSGVRGKETKEEWAELGQSGRVG
jgi:hypothetical protein